MLGMSAGSTTVAPCCFSTSIASAIAFCCASFSPPRGSFSPASVIAIVEERARDADARAFERVGLEVRAVVAVRRRRAGVGGGVVRIGRRAFHRAEQDRGVGDVLRHRPGRVLIGGDRDDAVAAHAADGRLDPREHVLVRRAQDRSRGFGADVRRPEIRGRADARARSAGAQRRPAIVERVGGARGRRAVHRGAAPVARAVRGSRRGSYGFMP